MNLKYQMAGHFKMVAHTLDDDGNIASSRVLADWFPNLITDGGLDRIATASFLDWCQVGTGNSTPVNAATSLDNRIASTSTIQADNSATRSSTPYYAYQQRTFRFAAGAAAGNLSEVGVGWASAGSLFSRALILDGGGSPTTITVLSTEVLDVFYEFRIYPPTVDGSGSVVIGGVTYTITSRAAFVTSPNYWDVPSSGVFSNTILTSAFNGAIGAITSGPTGSSSAPSSTSVGAYSNGSKQRNLTISWGLNNGNLSGGISTVLLYTSMGSTQFGISPAIPKDNTKTLDLNFTVSWARKAL